MKVTLSLLLGEWIARIGRGSFETGSRSSSLINFGAIGILIEELVELLFR